MNGELGNGATVPVENLGGVRAIASGPGHVLAVLADGTLAGWGDNECGVLGPAAPPAVAMAVPVPNIDHVVSVATEECGACVLLEEGTVECWGGSGTGTESMPARMNL